MTGVGELPATSRGSQDGAPCPVCAHPAHGQGCPITIAEDPAMPVVRIDGDKRLCPCMVGDPERDALGRPLPMEEP